MLGEASVVINVFGDEGWSLLSKAILQLNLSHCTGQWFFCPLAFGDGSRAFSHLIA